MIQDAISDYTLFTFNSVGLDNSVVDLVLDNNVVASSRIIDNTTSSSSTGVAHVVDLNVSACDVCLNVCVCVDKNKHKIKNNKNQKNHKNFEK